MVPGRDTSEREGSNGERDGQGEPPASDPYGKRSRTTYLLYAVVHLVLVVAIVTPAVLLVDSIVLVEGVIAGYVAWFVGVSVLLGDLIVAAGRTTLARIRGEGTEERGPPAAGNSRE